jgi:hypothetical protein
MRRLIVAALLVASFPTVDAWAQNIDWDQKSRSLGRVDEFDQAKACGEAYD